VKNVGDKVVRHSLT